MRLFLTGTDTGVGKTFVAARLVRALRRAGHDAVGMKPICCGDRDDALELHAASDACAELNEINPLWLRTPAAPYTAALIENRVLDLALVRESFARLRAKHASIIVEGVGGWLVPLEREYSVSDLAAELQLPVAVVVANRLGALNHTLLTLESIRARGVACAGLIINHVQPLSSAHDIAVATNRGVLEELCGVPILAELAFDQPEISLSGFSAAGLLPR